MVKMKESNPRFRSGRTTVARGHLQWLATVARVKPGLFLVYKANPDILLKL